MAGPGIRLDLHRTIADGPYAMIVDHDELFSSSSGVESPGTSFRRSGPRSGFSTHASKRGR